MKRSHSNHSTGIRPASTRMAIQKRYPKGIEKLEIGSGVNPEPGYVHLDIQDGLPDLDILGDVKAMPIPDNFVSDHIRAVHIMEHFCHPTFAGKSLQQQYGTIPQVLAECYRILKPGGKLLIVTPDFEKIGESTTHKRVPPEWLQRWSVGGHLNEYDVHHWLWTHRDAEHWFAEVGFHSFRDWNPVQGKRAWKLQFMKPQPGSKEWHELEWFHWLFFEGTK